MPSPQYQRLSKSRTLFGSHYLFVSRAWKRHYSCIPDMEQRHQVNAILTTLLEEMDTERFQRTLQQFLIVWKSKCPKFIEYFEKDYAREDRTRKLIEVAIPVWTRKTHAQVRRPRPSHRDNSTCTFCFLQCHRFVLAGFQYEMAWPAHSSWQVPRGAWAYSK